MKTIGYTPKQAERLKFAIEGDVAHIEDVARRMIHRIPDVGTNTASPDLALEQLRELASSLCAVVDRRTRR